MNLISIRQFIARNLSRHPSGILNILFKWFDRLTADYTNVQVLTLWLAAVCVGLVSVTYAKLFHLVELSYSKIYAHNSELIFILTPLLFLLAWWLVAKFAPEASGSGIPQVIATIKTPETTDPSFSNRLLSLKVIIVKIMSSLLCLAGGGAIGREGPTLQISAVIFHYFGRQLRRFYPHTDEKTWIITGAAAGLASAFNTPLGGIVYAIEELSLLHFNRIRTALLTAVIISGMVAQTILGSYLYLGFPALKAVRTAQWGAIIITGLSSGILGALFSRFMLWASRKRKELIEFRRLALFSVICGLGAAAINYAVPSSSGSGSELINKILFHGESANWLTLSGRLFGTAIAYLSGAAGGIFSPSLTIGACIGSYIADLFGSQNANLLAMLGMIGFLTGVTHTPFTSFILVMEMSDRHSAVFPMMVVSLLAYSAAKSIESKSFYESVCDDLLYKNDGLSNTRSKANAQLIKPT